MKRKAALCAFLFSTGLFAADSRVAGSPVLVELFTSEGCSSCPPADAVLERLDRLQPVAGAEAIVLSEHVDYWNHDGWADPYSSREYSRRQQGYADRFQLNDVYTPQMVVDGAAEFVGGDSPRALAAIRQAAERRKIAVRITPLPIEQENAKSLRFRIETDPFPVSDGSKATVYFAVAENEATTQVGGGENGGRRLHHVAVVRSLEDIGSTGRGVSFTKDLSITVPPGKRPDQFRVVAFVQERGQGRVLGAAVLMAMVGVKSR
jgi:hypothetical protein